jgi:ornithine cyclodeaminase/alanine dehydrogenase-like protein (mu-crystallin family)
VLILNNEEIETLVDIGDCMTALESAYRSLAAGDAMTTRRIDSMLPLDDDRTYAFKQMGGVIRGGVQALRINSDILRHPEIGGVRRRVKDPAAGGRWVGLVYLFDPGTGMPLAIMPDGVIQHLRVGATNGLAARYLGPAEVTEAALIGTGWQAQTQLLALAAVLEPVRVRVWSPNAQHVAEFCAAMQPRVNAELVPAGSPEEAVAGAQAVVAATSSISPVLRPDWVRPGTFFSCIKAQEVDEALLGSGRVFLHSRRQLKEEILVAGDGERPTPGGWWEEPAAGSYPDLIDLITGAAPGRASKDDVMVFVNNIGLGLQFAAVGALVLERARARGAGRELPDDWFTESVHP